jgi:DNA-binding NarL/FixJ family response regulator
VRVVVADDSMLTREGIVRLLRDAGIEVVAEAEDADALLRHVASVRPDVAIVDIRMPPTRMRDWSRFARSEPTIRRSARSSCPSMWNRATRCGSSRTNRNGSGICSKTACRTSRS